MKRKVCVITGTRAEYGLLTPVMKEIQFNQNLKLLVMVAGMHLSKEFGLTVTQIKMDGFEISYQVIMNPVDDNLESMAIAIGNGIIGMTKEFIRIRPDIILILGDRIEALSGAVVGSYLNIPIAHIHGGDKSKAGIDESARHAITKLSHIHFAATRTSFDRIVKLGERRENIFLVGAPGLDSIYNEKLWTKDELLTKYHFDIKNPYIMILQHSVTTQVDQAKKQIIETLMTIRRLKMNTLIFYPNSDSGGRVIIKEIEKFRNYNFIKIIKNLPHIDFLSFLKYSSALIGNSSCGIIEASAFKLPVINIGIRQEGRERSINVIDVPHDRNAILNAVKIVLDDQMFQRKIKTCLNLYGDGHAGKQISEILSKIDIKSLLQKQIVY